MPRHATRHAKCRSAPLRRIAFAIAGTCVVALSGAVGAASAQDETAALDREDSLRLNYSLYGSGLRLALFEAAVNTTANRYAITIDGRTAGVIGLIGDWRATIVAEGRLGEGVQPERFELNVDDDERTMRRLIFGADGVSAEFNPPEDNLPEIPEADLRGAVDPVSALIGASLVTQPNRCPPRTAVFDGTRRYDIAFLRIRTTTLDGAWVDGFSGQAVECQARMIPVSGEWRDADSSSFWRHDRPDDPPDRMAMNVFFAQLSDGGPPVLVRAERRGENGAFMLHLTDSASN